ncbi:MAG TPA: hypothetical protein CFH79_04465 [Sulfurospirillum sp. UBA11407]|nr:MAG TPA: hypothetical protein CFH79_04465 [Sulfurospirillum sp. UBA11407]
MFNAEDIILLEKQWLKYKIKTRMKFFLGFIVCFIVILLTFFSYSYFLKEKTSIRTNAPLVNSLTRNHEENRSSEEFNAITLNTAKDESNTTQANLQENNNKERNKTTNTSDFVNIIETTTKAIKQEEMTPSYYLKIIPTLKNNDLFTSNVASLSLHIPFEKQKAVKNQIEEKKSTFIENKQTSTISKKEANIDISTSEIDTITYLKDKFYTTENIVFAIMLSEEFYNKKNYEESIKWALTANEIDPKNDKTWYWFARNKVKLGQKDDAIKALKAFLSENSSNRLKTLLKEINNGDQ